MVSCARNSPDGTSAVDPHLFVKADVSQEMDAKRLVSEVNQRYEALDILVNSAGYGGSLGKAWDIPSEEFATHWANNMMTAVWLTRLVLPAMLARGQGTIVYVASQAAKRAVPGVSAYSASKFALVGFAQSVAKEIAGSGVKLLTVCPAGMDTPMREALFHDAARQQKPEIVANIVVDLIAGCPDLPSGSEVLIRGGSIVHVESSRSF